MAAEQADSGVTAGGSGQTDMMPQAADTTTSTHMQNFSNRTMVLTGRLGPDEMKKLRRDGWDMFKCKVHEQSLICTFRRNKYKKKEP